MILFLWLLLVSPPCDQTLWQHVYNPQRLKVLAPCQEFVGVKQDATRGKRSNGCRREADGDDHCWLKLEGDQVKLINNKNVINEGANLVYEPMCQHKVTQADAMKVCRNWAQQILIAPIGARLRLRGAYVLDTEHGHTECHPCEVVEVLK